MINPLANFRTRNAPLDAVLAVAGGVAPAGITAVAGAAVAGAWACGVCWVPEFPHPTMERLMAAVKANIKIVGSFLILNDPQKKRLSLTR
jgi:hypothetical protein